MDPKQLKPLLEQVTNHVTYPAQKQDFVQACNTLRLPESATQWLAANLPDRTYQSAQEVFKALGM